MFKLKTTKKKLATTIILEVVFTTLLILLLVYVRQQSLDYIEEIQDYSQDINLIQQDITNQNLNEQDRQQIDSTIITLDKILNKALILLQLILPLSILILSLLLFYPIWYINTKISIKRFLAYSIFPLILLLTTVYFVLNYIAYAFFFVDTNPLVYLIISAVLLAITYYVALFGLSNKKSLKVNLKLSLKKLPSVITFYVLILITNVIYLVLAFWLFFLTFVKEAIVIQLISLLILIIIINLQRIHLVKKVCGYTLQTKSI